MNDALTTRELADRIERGHRATEMLMCECREAGWVEGDSDGWRLSDAGRERFGAIGRIYPATAQREAA